MASFSLPPRFKWRQQVGAVDLSAPVIGPDGVVWIANAQGEIIGFNTDGSLHARRKLDDEIVGTPAIDPATNEIYVLAQHKKVVRGIALKNAGWTAIVSFGMFVTRIRRLSRAHWPMKPWPSSTCDG